MGRFGALEGEKLSHGFWEGHGNPPGAQNGHKKFKNPKNDRKFENREFSYFPGGGRPIFPGEGSLFFPVCGLGAALLNNHHLQGSLLPRASWAFTGAALAKSETSNFASFVLF